MENKTERIFVCSCDFNTAMTVEQLSEHLQMVHGIDAKNQRGSRLMTTHVDCSDWYSTTYEWTFPGGITVLETCKEERDKSDLY